MRIYPRSKGSATRTAAVLRAAAADLDMVAAGLRRAAAHYAARWSSDDGAGELRASLDAMGATLMVLHKLSNRPRRYK